MTAKTPDNPVSEKIPFKLHPKVFDALGRDLVTNDVVAVIELVKNSYDAFAKNVWIRFGDDSELGKYIEIEDDGLGMTRNIIENSWCVVATPYKNENPIITKGKEKRRVSGAKGLGRLAVARLGEKLILITQAPNDICWQATVNWVGLSESNEISHCFINLQELKKSSQFKISGTKLKIYNLHNQWDNNKIADLEQNLTRLLSPFSEVKKFNISLNRNLKAKTEKIKIEPPLFLSQPIYSITGKVDEKGDISCEYRYQPIGEGNARKINVSHKWEQVYEHIQDRSRFQFDRLKTHCGSFSFEIRAWDIAGEDAEEIAQKFNFQKSQVRKEIKAHKGISIYRDGVLVLPKSENARDWLGLDLRRVSRIGLRLSTNQIVGYVSISSEKNQKIEDTSDRERLASCLEVAEFEELLKAIVALLENERNIDRVKKSPNITEDLFQALSATELIDEITALSKEGATASEILPMLNNFNRTLISAKDTIQRNFVYYSRMATVGTIAEMLIHEIRNRTTIISLFLQIIKEKFNIESEDAVLKSFNRASNALDSLEHLADTFAPLASRSFRRGKRQSIIEERISNCISWGSGEIKRKNVRITIPNSNTLVSIDPGELDAVLLNLLANSLYWITQVSIDRREIEFLLKSDIKNNMVSVLINDSGPGFNIDIEKIFLPGITKKPGGIGMGLTVASELILQNGGKMYAVDPGFKGGATIGFDLPLQKRIIK